METFTFHIIAGKNQEFLTGIKRGMMPPILKPDDRDESHVESVTIDSGIEAMSWYLVDLQKGSPFQANQLIKFEYIYPAAPSAVFRKLIAAWQRKHPELRGYAVLEAHGTDNGGIWSFQDGERNSDHFKQIQYQPIQTWVNRYDGLALVLLIRSCNAANQGICAKKSIVIHYDGLVKSGDDGDCEETGIIALSSLEHGGLRFYLPGYGYLEDKPVSEIEKIVRSCPKVYPGGPFRVI